MWWYSIFSKWTHLGAEGRLQTRYSRKEPMKMGGTGCYGAPNPGWFLLTWASMTMCHVDKRVNQWNESVVKRPGNKTSFSVTLCSSTHYSTGLNRTGFLKLKCAYASPEGPVTIQILTPWVWGWASEWKQKSLSCVLLFATPWIVVHRILQARILEWAAFPFSRGSSQPRDQSQVSCIAGGFFTSWATREAHEYWSG